MSQDRPPQAKPDSVTIKVAYVGMDDAIIQLANQFLIQIEQDEFTVVFGQFAPPALLGSPAEVRAQAETLPFVPIRVLARYTMSPTRARELRDLLTRQLDAYTESSKERASAAD